MRSKRRPSGAEEPESGVGADGAMVTTDSVRRNGIETVAREPIGDEGHVPEVVRVDHPVGAFGPFRAGNLGRNGRDKWAADADILIRNSDDGDE
jgi:hypothetical protein